MPDEELTSINSFSSFPQVGNRPGEPYFKLCFQITCALIIFALSSEGMGNHLFGYTLFTNVSTLFIYLTLLFQLITGTLRFPGLLIGIYLYILIHISVIYVFNLSFVASLKHSLVHLLGLIVFSLSIFSFVSIYRHYIVRLVRVYYRLVLFVVFIAFMQLIVFIFLNKDFMPQHFISGYSQPGRILFFPEILNLLPRVIGLSSEPAAYAIFILPGVYMALKVITGKGGELGLHNKLSAWVILVGIVLSFSLVGYLGLILCLFSILAQDINKQFMAKLGLVLCIVAVVAFISRTTIGAKINSLIEIQKDIRHHKYTTSDLSTFALVSNLLVANESVKKSFGLGTGLNTHNDTYDATISNQFSASQIIMQLNKTDAGSLLIRLVSEFGFPGIILFFIFLFFYKLNKQVREPSIKAINSMSLVMLISYCIRNGAYLSVFFILFLALYYYSYLIEKEHNY